MKYIIQIFAVIAVIALLTSCSSTSKGTEKNTSADAPAGAATEVYIDVTDAPTEVTPSESATSKDINDKTPAGAGEEEEKTSADAGAKSELTADRWSLTAVYRDGEQKSIAVQYGSVIRETGAYIRFNEDDTFECILGIPGCKGTYAVENGDVVLHITTKYTGKNEGDACDEYETVKWDYEAGTLSFDFYGVTNVFTK